MSRLSRLSLNARRPAASRLRRRGGLLGCLLGYSLDHLGLIFLGLTVLAASGCRSGRPQPAAPSAAPSVSVAPSASPTVAPNVTSEPSVTVMPTPTPVAIEKLFDFTLTDLNGRPVKLASFRGRPLIVDFWATWCAPCRKQIPELEAIYRKYRKPNGGLTVVGLSCDQVQGEGLKAVKPFVRKFKMNYPVLMATEPLADALGVESLPTTLFIGPDGKLVARLEGFAQGELAEVTAALLKASAREGVRRAPSAERAEGAGAAGPPAQALARPSRGASALAAR